NREARAAVGTGIPHPETALQPIIVLLLTLCEAALAQGRPRPRHTQPHMTVLEQEAFQELMVAGRLAGPGGTVTVERRSVSFPPMVRLRLDFAREMVESVDQIQ
ncbi:MAG: hypothetical protein VX000_04570, partial [Myxococcota bacterium]|nr:hypothetical protein [Myxococcota bacterium]